MQIDPKIVEAASDLIRTPRGATMLTAADRARRVLKAASENVPDEALKAAVAAEQAYYEKFPLGGKATDRLRAALSAGLAEMAKGE